MGTFIYVLPHVARFNVCEVISHMLTRDDKVCETLTMMLCLLLLGLLGTCVWVAPNQNGKDDVLGYRVVKCGIVGWFMEVLYDQREVLQYQALAYDSEAKRVITLYHCTGWNKKPGLK